jgi:hypothetical protein
MAIDILGLLTKFRSIDDRDFEGVVYKTHTPQVAPLAYHTVVFKPAAPELRERRAVQLSMPLSLRALYETCNGAVLFGGALRVFGLRPDDYQLDREDWLRKALPIDIVGVNDEHSRQLARRNSVCFGEYCFDGSLICVDRRTEQVACFVGSDFRQLRSRWGTLDEWLTSEMQRLASHFDENGLRQVDEALSLPSLIQ